MTAIKPIRILIVDDEADFLQSLKEIAMAADIPEENIILADTSTGAIELLRKNKIDVAFLDIRLPDFNGLAVLRHIKYFHPDVACYMISGVAELDEAEMARDYGACEIISKPVDPSKIEEIIKGMMSGTSACRIS